MSSVNTSTIRSALTQLGHQPHPTRSATPKRSTTPQPSAYPDIHDTAARQDGIVKILTGLILGVFSLGLASAGVVGLHALLQNQQLKLWAFAIGVPGLLMALGGLVLIVWGAAKLISGRGNG